MPNRRTNTQRFLMRRPEKLMSADGSDVNVSESLDQLVTLPEMD